MKLDLISLAEDINKKMPDQVVQKTILGLNEIHKSVKNSNILIVGVAYKSDINDVRESPAFDVMTLLNKLGAILSYHDNYVDEVNFEGERLLSKEITEKELNKYDCAIILTHHSYLDIELIVKSSKVVIDTRNATNKIKSNHIFKI